LVEDGDAVDLSPLQGGLETLLRVHATFNGD
jgi:hypothetical protein